MVTRSLVHTTLPTWRVSDLTIITYLFDSLSLLGAIATICVYLYLYFFQHEISQKCTLRFVFICMVSVIIETIMDMLTMSGVSGYRFCATAMTIFLFFNTIAAMALCCIGLDLVAVFVFHLHRANKATLYYLILCVTVAIISIAVPVAHLVKSYDSEYKDNRNPNCWYSEETPDSMAHVYYHWMWYYSVLMAVSVVSALCSVLAIWKLHRRYKKSRAEMRPTRPNTNASPALSTTEYNKILAKIIVRCAIYSVVPLLTNVWTFVNHILLFVLNETNTVMLYLDSLFSSSLGIFVALIFFTEPPILKFLRKKSAEEQPDVGLDDLAMRPRQPRSRSRSNRPVSMVVSTRSSMHAKLSTSASGPRSPAAAPDEMDEDYLGLPIIFRTPSPHSSSVQPPLPAPDLEAPLSDPHAIPRTAKWILQELKDE